MKLSTFLPIAIFIGIQALLIQVVDQLLAPVMPPAGNAGFGWIAFQAWAMYFMAGCTPEGGAKALAGYGWGVIASILIMLLGGAFSGAGFWAFPLALLILVPPVICLELAVSPLNFVPAVFIGAGVYFGFMTYIKGANFGNAALTELVYCLIGLVFGYVTVAFRGWYEAALKAAALRHDPSMKKAH